MADRRKRGLKESSRIWSAGVLRMWTQQTETSGEMQCGQRNASNPLNRGTMDDKPAGKARQGKKRKESRAWTISGIYAMPTMSDEERNL